MDIERLEVTESGIMEWTVTIPSIGQLRSSVFSYLHNECRLDLLNDGTHYCLDMTVSGKYPELVSRFNIKVALVGMIMKQSETIVVHRASVYRLWRLSIQDVRRSLLGIENYTARTFIMALRINNPVGATVSTTQETINFRSPPTAPSTGFSFGLTNQGKSLCGTIGTTNTATSITCLERLSKDLSTLDQGLNSDVEFLCADQSIKAHSEIVSARSPVIASMLQSDMVEGRTKTIKIPNMEPDIFKQFLRFLYTEKLDELTFDSAMNLYDAGYQYVVLGLTKMCSNFLMEHLSVQNAWEVLVVADRHSDVHLVGKVVDYMVENRVPEVWNGWSTFHDDHVKLAIKVLVAFKAVLRRKAEKRSKVKRLWRRVLK